MSSFKQFMSKFKKGLSTTLTLFHEESYKPTYRIISIEQDKRGTNQAVIQVIGKKASFKMKPEEILAKNSMTDQFSPRDIRTLTYLGYLGINGAKYQILAKKLSKNADKMLFALHQKDTNKIATKTADEISRDDDLLKNLNSRDAHMIGYARATEEMLFEEKEKLRLISEIKELEGS